MKKEKSTKNSKRFGTWHLFSLLFILMLILPTVLSLFGIASSAGPVKPHTKAPSIEWRALLAPEYYQAWGNYVDGRLGMSKVLVKAKRWMDYRVFNMTDVREVFVGREGWMYPRTSVEQSRLGACGEKKRLRRMIFDLTALAHLAKLSGRRLIVTVAPDKTTIYPEYTGVVFPRSPDCRETIYDLFLDECKLAKVDWFVRLDDLLIKAKQPDNLLYDKTGAVWNQRGADIAAKALLAAVFKSEEPTPVNHHDLAALVMETSTAPLEPTAPTGRHFSSAVLYGGMAMAELMPMLSRPFNRTDAIYSDTIPSSNHMENLSTYDVAMIVLDVPQLARLRLDLDRICQMLGIEPLADQENSIPLKTVSGQSHLSLKMEEKKLKIKSLGEGASFVLPSLPGSEPHTLRLLALDISAPNSDTLLWRIDGPSAIAGEKPIHKGENRLYFALPVQPSVRLHIHPGRQTGLYYISSANLLEYANGLSLVVSPETDTYKVPQPSQPGNTGMIEAAAPLSPIPTADDATLPMVRLHDLEEMRVFQRTGSTADIVVSGTFQGHPQAIEARVSNHASKEWITPWTVIDSAPVDGVFMGILPEIPQGGWYRLSVRFSNAHEINDAGQSRWGIGMLVACIGQSNMKEWFHTGTDLRPHTLLSLHRDGHWMAMGDKGNGAVAFGNRLIGKLGIPVGLLDYAVNGSGLRKEADWGTGYWSDRSDDAIYDRFVKAVANAGGALEYVVWMQGEADAARATISENQYRSTLKRFIEQQVRQDIVNGSSRQQLPFLVVGMVKRPVGKDAPHQAIRMAQYKVTEALQECYLSATSIDLENMGRQHLSPSAYTTLGLRVAQTVLYLLGEESYYRGPSVFGAILVDDTTIDVRISHRGGSDFTPQRAISGWQVIGDGSTQPIAGVTRKGNTEIRIIMERSLDGPVTIRYLYGAMPDTDRSAHDNSPMELPLEPVEIEIE